MSPLVSLKFAQIDHSRGMRIIFVKKACIVLQLVPRWNWIWNNLQVVYSYGWLSYDCTTVPKASRRDFLETRLPATQLTYAARMTQPDLRSLAYAA